MMATAWQKALRRGGKRKACWKPGPVTCLRADTHEVDVDTCRDGVFTARRYPDGHVTSGTRRLTVKEVAKLEKLFKKHGPCK
jgi:hypothetical protein